MQLKPTTVAKQSNVLDPFVATASAIMILQLYRHIHKLGHVSYNFNFYCNFEVLTVTVIGKFCALFTTFVSPCHCDSMVNSEYMNSLPMHASSSVLIALPVPHDVHSVSVHSVHPSKWSVQSEMNNKCNYKKPKSKNYCRGCITFHKWTLSSITMNELYTCCSNIFRSKNFSDFLYDEDKGISFL